MLTIPSQLGQSQLGTFTPVESFLGALMIGCVTFLMMLYIGRITGISGMLNAAVTMQYDNARFAFVLGLLFAGRVLLQFFGFAFEPMINAAWWLYVLSGVLVGVGTQLGSGCTSGHMICGVSRLSPRSLVATAVFCSVGVAVANLATCRSFIFGYEGIIGAPKLLGPSIVPTTLPSDALLVQILTAFAAILAAFAVAPLLRKLSTKVFDFAVGLLAGVLMGLGIGIAGMTAQSKVLGFMAFWGPWNPSLALVVIGGVLPNMVAWPYLLKPRHPLFAPKYGLPTKTKLDWRLLTGAAIFGLGWGLLGLCPGPILLIAATGERNALLSLAGVIGGMLVYKVADELSGWPRTPYLWSKSEQKTA